MTDFFTHPTKPTATIFTALGIIGWILTIVANTDLFTEKFDPNPIIGGLMIGSFWAVVRIWINYDRLQRENGD